MPNATTILNRIAAGEAHAAEELLAILYKELHKLASRRLANDPAGQSLQTTELVHEAYLRLIGSDQQWESNAHFFGAAAEAMRRILVDRARQKAQVKRGGEFDRVALSDNIATSIPCIEETLLVDDLLGRFAEKYPLEAELVKLRYFAGFSITEAGKILNIPSSTTHRYWTFAKAWIFRELRSDGDSDEA